MSVNTITGPSANDIKSAYNPIVFDVFVTSVNEVCYCDIYFFGTYYKTLVSTSPIYGGGSTQHRFDISDAAQEYIKTAVPYPATHTTMQFGIYDNIAQCFCKFRGSTISVNNVVTPQGPLPVQGNMDTNPVAGGGTQASTFYIVDAAIQANDATTFIAHLTAYRNNPLLVGPFGIDTAIFRCYPLSHAKTIKQSKLDYAQFPFFVAKNGFDGSATANVSLSILAVAPNGTATSYHLGAFNQNINDVRRYYIPTGIPQLLALDNTIPFDTFDYYYVFVKSVTHADKMIFATPKIKVVHHCADRARIWFRNNLGSLDILNFNGTTEETDVVSNPKYTNNDFQNKFGVFGRTNTKSVDRVTAIGTFEENDMPIIKELLASSLAFVERTGTDDGQLRLHPIKITDTSKQTLKFEDRYEYEMTIEYEYGVRNIHVNGDKGE